jgi:FkbM family methyltransferase
VLISVSELSRYWGVSPNGVLHIGAHLGEEAQEYENFNWIPIIWVEAQPLLVKKLESKFQHPNHRVINAAIWNEDNVSLKLHVASNSMSSSLLEFGSHASSYPEIKFVNEIEVLTKRIDTLLDATDMPNFLNIDIQGAELAAIQSLGDLITKVDYIFVEVNKREVYKECTRVGDLDSFLEDKGFNRVTTRWYVKQGWGDALYIRNSKVKFRKPNQYLAVLLKDFLFYFRQILSFLQINMILKWVISSFRKQN